MENNGEYWGLLENTGEGITLKNQEVHAELRYLSLSSVVTHTVSSILASNCQRASRQGQAQRLTNVAGKYNI